MPRLVRFMLTVVAFTFAVMSVEAAPPTKAEIQKAAKQKALEKRLQAEKLKKLQARETKASQGSTQTSGKVDGHAIAWLVHDPTAPLTSSYLETAAIAQTHRPTYQRQTPRRRRCTVSSLHGCGIHASGLSRFDRCDSVGERCRNVPV